MMILQDEMLRATRRFDASGRAATLEAQREMEHAARRDEAGAPAPADRPQAAAAAPMTVRLPHVLLRLWFVRHAAT